jgi:hypothetical protein
VPEILSAGHVAAMRPYCITDEHVALCDSHEALRERLEALEEIRQRVANGWTALHPATTGGEPFWSEWANGPVHPMSPELASLLWPSDTSDA